MQGGKSRQDSTITPQLIDDGNEVERLCFNREQERPKALTSM